jgi:two-component system sensor histidine kinase ChvG
MALAMLVLPQLIVVGWSFMERDIGGKLQGEVRASATEAAEAIRDGQAQNVQEIAEKWGTRIRLVSKENVVVIDADADHGTDLVHQVGALFLGPDGAPTMRELDETFGPVTRREEVTSVTGWDSGPPMPPPLVEGRPRAVASGCRTSPAGKLLVCHATMPITYEGAPHVIYVQESSRRAVRALYDLRYHLARLSVVMLPLTLLFSWWMGKRMVRPIEWLRERVLEKARAANPRADIDLRGGEEVRDLAEAFNDLLGALDEKRRANEAFAADLVHEFKNPVAAIRSAAESLERGGAADEKRAVRIAKILKGSSAQLDALVSQFLDLARAEAGMPNEARIDVDLAELVKGITGAYEVTFKLDLSSVVVNGVSSRLDSLVRNLIDNAVAFAGADGEVRVSLTRDADSAILEVSDSGPGIPAADLPHVFERFFSARKKGTGLGLALVKAIAEAHGGSVSARSEGATFTVKLPATLKSGAVGP